ncbi:hypothetical protein Dimus_031151 [Dionaea muscipula]
MESSAIAQPSEAAAAAARRLGYVGWEEEVVSNDKGRRKVHYSLKRKGGESDLVVVGKEKSLRHMTYHYSIQNQVLLDSLPPSFLVKLRSRREVIEWLSSIVPDTQSLTSTRTRDNSFCRNDRGQLDLLKGTLSQKLDRKPKAFLWLGSSWTCKKKRMHYQSCYHGGAKISVNDFVYVLAEEDKQLVAHLDDMYEDSGGNYMVAVRWFHKIDEVDINLPHKFNDREIFFSLCLQDLSIECIDGLACVLSPQHFDKFQSQAKHPQLHPFFCHRQYDNYELKAFDITQVKGYWDQEILSYLYSVPSLDESHLLDGCMKHDDPTSCGVVNTSRKRVRLSRGFRGDTQIVPRTDSLRARCSGAYPSTTMGSVGSLSRVRLRVDKNGGSDTCFARKEVSMGSPLSHLAIGQQVEVLSQDSGMRGCWFRALVIKKHKDKVKVRYQDLKDADDEANNLEEWVLASRIAVQDNLGFRLNGRTIVRPAAFFDNGKVSWVFDVGAIVDAWWNNGWWEGIVIGKESEGKVRVYFPGEKQEAVFSHGELRHSQEWLGSVWNYFKGRPDIVSSILLSDLEMRQEAAVGKAGDVNGAQVAVSSTCSRQQGDETHASEGPGPGPGLDNGVGCERNSHVNDLAIPDLLKDVSLCQLRWKSSRKRNRFVGRVQSSQYVSDSTTRLVYRGSHNIDNFKSFNVDRDNNCKYIRDSLYSSAVVPCLTSLVMSR